jgi:hypothetical protein
VVDLSEQQYRLLCENCDRLLLLEDSSIERIAIKWLHVIREHPALLKSYASLFQQSNKILVTCLSLIFFFRSRARWIRHIVKGLYLNQKSFSVSKNFPNNIDVLFISHLLNSSQVGNEADFYFGELPNELVFQEKKVVIALINHSDKFEKPTGIQWNESKVPRIIFPNISCVSDLLNYYKRLKAETKRLKVRAQKESDNFFKKIIERTSQEALSDGTLTTLRLHDQIGILVGSLKPKVVIVTHEGHAWERMAFAAARQALPGVWCIGYQHSAVFRLQHSLRRKLNSNYNPDQILTAGEVSATQLKLAPGLNGIPISVLGSNRSQKIIVDQRKHAQIQFQIVKRNNKACLVIPEGFSSECSILFEYSLACAKAMPEIQFIWRLHPIITFEFLTSKHPMLKVIPSNVVLSNGKLDDDIERSQWVLYRGSTAIVQATVAGLRPIYLKLKEELTIDPLYELDKYREIVSSISDFQHIIESDNNNMKFSSSEANLLSTINYCKNFFMPFDLQLILNIISKRIT